MNDEIAIARKWLEQSPLYLDTETTGLDDQAEIVQLAVVDDEGRPLIDTLVRPVRQIPDSATAIHGITNEMVAVAPTLADVAPWLGRIISGHLVVVYNLGYDERMLVQSAEAVGLPPIRRTYRSVCAMILYSDYRGEWSDYRQSNRWHKLTAACELERVSTAGIREHSAVGDCEMTRRLVHHMAAQKLLWEKVPA